MSGYRNSYRRSSYGARPVTPGRVAKVNARPGPCRYCQEQIPAGAGQLWREESGAWSVVHVTAEWSGSPVSGQYIGGCPIETDAMNERGKFGGPGGARSVRDSIAGAGAAYAARNAGDATPARRSSYARMSTSGRCTHVDYPCCGCGS